MKCTKNIETCGKYNEKLKMCESESTLGECIYNNKNNKNNIQTIIQTIIIKQDYRLPIPISLGCSISYSNYSLIGENEDIEMENTLNALRVVNKAYEDLKDIFKEIIEHPEDLQNIVNKNKDFLEEVGVIE